MNTFTNKTIVLIVGLFIQSYVISQETAKVINNDSLKNAIDLNSMVIFGDTLEVELKKMDPTSDLRTDELVQELEGVSMIRRGNYAAEPTFRGMSSGQLSVTIDGMKIFGACTDKMDPVSSYVSSNNLESVSVSSNSNHSSQGSNVGGGFDFQTKGPQFNAKKKLTGSAGIGYQTNGNGRLANFNLNYGDSAWAVNLNANYQKFDSYTAGGGEEIRYTQFEKVNFALSASWMISTTEIVKAQLIYDDAYHVGYPALPMDVSFAGGRIYSLSYKKYIKSGTLSIKAYGNNITHIMDDTKREFVPIHMDMPGKSDTYGAFLNAKLRLNRKHTLTLNPDYYYNVSFADMTMYPNDPTRPEEPSMYMITWPDVRRHSGSLLLSDKFKINTSSSLTYSGKMEYVTSEIFSDFGIRQLEAIGKDGSQPSNYVLGNVAILYQKEMSDSWSLFGQGGYAERQPTVSEGFGFYLFNSMDGYDYIGDPSLNKEKAIKGSLGVNWSKNQTRVEGKVYHYQFQDYIIGVVDSTFDGMTIGSNGVKVYENIPAASISGFEINFMAPLFKKLKFQNATQFSYGIDHHKDPLQMIPPLQNTTKLGYIHNDLEFRVEAVLTALQNNPRTNAGETPTPAYGLLNLHMQSPFTLFSHTWSTSVRINNILDTNYWDHLDWNSIPRPGRSFVFKVSMTF